MSRNVDWNIEPSRDGRYSWEQVTVAVLMDIRAELRRLNILLNCQNFIDIPNKLSRIAMNTRKPKRKVRR